MRCTVYLAEICVRMTHQITIDWHLGYGRWLATAVGRCYGHMANAIVAMQQHRRGSKRGTAVGHIHIAGAGAIATEWTCKALELLHCIYKIYMCRLHMYNKLASTATAAAE